MKQSLHLRLLSVLLLMLCGMTGVRADIAPVDEILWADNFGTEGDKVTDFTKKTDVISTYTYSGRSGYLLNNTTVTYTGDDNVKLSTGSGTNVSSGHLWFNKQAQGVFTTSAINLYGAQVVNFSLDRSKGLTKVDYSFNGSDWTNLWTESTATAIANKNADITTTGQTSIYIKITENNNNNNLRVDNLSLKVVTAGEESSSPNITLSSNSIALDAVDKDATSDTKSLTVTPANLTDDITYALTKGEDSPFSVTGTLSKTEESTLAVALKSTAKKGLYTDELTITSGSIVQNVALCAFVNGNFNVAELTAAADALGSGETSAYDYATVGYIKEITTAWSSQFNNITFNIADEKTSEETFIVYRANAADGTVGANLQVGDKVSVTGKLTNYNGVTLEYATGCIVALIEPATKTTYITVDATKSVYAGKTVELAASVNSGATLTYSSSNTDVATVDASGIVTGVSVGTATITITAPAYDGWPDTSVGVEITVVALPNYIFYESFDRFNGTGGNDGSWSGNIASSTIKNGDTDEAWADFVSGNGANKCAKFGKTSGKGSAQTGKLSLISGTMNCKMTFKAGAWDGSSEKTTLNLEVTGGGTLSQSSVTLAKGAWTTYTIYITGATENTQITFIAAESKNNRFFLDEVLIKEYGNETVSISEVGYATMYYGEKNLVVPEGVTAHTVFTDGDELLFTHDYMVDDVIPAGTGVVLEGAEGSYIFEATTDEGIVDEYNMLRGSDVEEETTGGATYYKLSLNRDNEAGSVGFYWGEEGGAAFTNGAHKAYLALPAEAAAPRCFLFGDMETAIEKVESMTIANGNSYNLAGQKVQAGYKGIVICNGKKVLVK